MSVVAHLPVPGEQLPNGRTLVAIRLLAPARHGWAGDLYAVLALTGHIGDTYAVWTYVHALSESEISRCYGGHYTGDFDEALDDWRTRKGPGEL